MKINNIPLFRASQIRDCERMAITRMDISETELMASAGRAAFKALHQFFPSAKKLLIYCGSGNNAGDGYVLAKLAHEAGFAVIVNQYKPPDKLPAAAKAAAEQALNLGIACHYMEDFTENDNDSDLIVDALLGTGLDGVVSEPLLTAINQINASDLPVLSIDIPSGLNADSGCVMGVCVRATATITFIGLKTGMMTLDGPDHCGDIECDDLSLSACLSAITPAAEVLVSPSYPAVLPKRLKNCHKNDFGHVLIIGGGNGMPGSVHLAANAALRVGAGQVTIATRSQYAAIMPCGLPEAMIYGISRAAQIEPLIDRATVCVIGPGLGTDDWAAQLFEKVMVSQRPIIIDASALRLLAQAPQRDDNWVLTPHPGEAAALLGCQTNDIQADRYHAVSSLQDRYGGNIVLKGVGSLVATDKSAIFLCCAGNSGMATAGMGDVLSGVIAGLAAQSLSLAEATKTGVWLHATAADRAVMTAGERGLMASDLMAFLRVLVNHEDN